MDLDVATQPETHRSVVWLARSPWFWVPLVVSLVTSPALFWSSLVVGGALVAVGVALWIAHWRLTVLAVGLGLVFGSTPYALAALRVMLAQ